MKHRKSSAPLDSWWDEERDLAALPSLQDIAARELAAMRAAAAEDGFEVAPFTDTTGPRVEVNEREYAVWLAVELAKADSASAVRRRERRGRSGKPLLAAQLAVEFGSRDAARAAVEVYAEVQRRLREAGPGATVKPPDALAVRRLETRRKLAQIEAKPVMSREAIVEYSAARAHDLGFSPVDIWAEKQGNKSGSFDAEKQARRRIVVELRDRGAKQADIGAVFGGRKQSSISTLEAAGRKHQQQQDKGGK